MVRLPFLIFATAATYAVVGCSAIRSDPPSPAAEAPPSSTTSIGQNKGRYGPDVIHLDGLRDIEFGDTEQQLVREGALTQPAAPCGPRLTDMATVSPVFAGDRLVLLWVDPPMQTPEGISGGTPVAEVRDTYPAAKRLTAPRGTYRFDGLLAAEGDRAYLFLHDGKTVRKTIAGYAEYAQRLFDDGLGAC